MPCCLISMYALEVSFTQHRAASCPLAVRICYLIIRHGKGFDRQVKGCQPFALVQAQSIPFIGPRSLRIRPTNLLHRARQPVNCGATGRKLGQRPGTAVHEQLQYQTSADIVRRPLDRQFALAAVRRHFARLLTSRPTSPSNSRRQCNRVPY